MGTLLTKDLSISAKSTATAHTTNPHFTHLSSSTNRARRNSIAATIIYPKGIVARTQLARADARVPLARARVRAVRRDVLAAAAAGRQHEGLEAAHPRRARVVPHVDAHLLAAAAVRPAVERHYCSVHTQGRAGEGEERGEAHCCVLFCWGGWGGWSGDGLEGWLRCRWESC